MKKIYILWIILLIIPIFLTGCYDSESIEKYYYAVAIGIDKSEKSKIKLSIQIATTSSSESSSSSQSTESKIYSVDCENINVGINILNNYLSKQINLSHCSSIVFSEEIAKDGLKEYVNTLSNNTEVRPTVNVIISDSKASDILENITNSGESFSSRYYEFLINSDVLTGYAIHSEFDDFFYSINHSTETPIANYIVVNDKILQSNGMAIFKKDKFIGFLTPLETMTHLLVTDNLEESIVSITNPYDSNSTIELLIQKEKSPENEVKIINGKPIINTKIYVSGKIQNMPSYTGEESVKVIEDELNRYLTHQIENYYYTIIKKYNIDLPNFSKKIANNYLTNSAFKKINWNDIFKDTFYNVSVESTVTTSLYTKK